MRQTAGYLPEASVAFIDEVRASRLRPAVTKLRLTRLCETRRFQIFKANSSILNALLTLLNERLFDNGAARTRVPLLCMVAASNELPESEELDALYDRFLLRAAVAPVSEAGVDELLALPPPLDADADGADASATDATEVAAAGGAPLLTLRAEALGAVRRAARGVALPDDVSSLLKALRAHLAQKTEPPVYISDRRLVKAAALLRVAAHTCGRERVAPADALLLEFVFARSPTDAALVRDFVLTWIAKRDLAPKQFAILAAGLTSRACAEDVKPRARAAMAAEAAAMQQEVVAELLEQSRPALRTHLWLSEESKARAEQTIRSLAMQVGAASAAAELTAQLRTAVTLQCGLQDAALPPGALARALRPATAAPVATVPMVGEVMARIVSVTRLENTTGRSNKFYEVACIEYRACQPLPYDPYAGKHSAGDARYVLCARWGSLSSYGSIKRGWPTLEDFCKDTADASVKADRIADRKVREGYYRVPPGSTTHISMAYGGLYGGVSQKFELHALKAGKPADGRWRPYTFTHGPGFVVYSLTPHVGAPAP